jgi:hypothetical protein
MTQEGQGPTPDETTRPVTTRWSEDPLANDDDLAPPFVPGRSAASGPAPDGAAETGEDGESPFPFDSSWDQEGEPLEAEPASPEAGESDFPFDQLDDEPGSEDRPDVEADRGDFLPGDGGPATTPEEAVAAQPGPDGWEPFGADTEEADEADAEPDPYADSVSYADAEPYQEAEPYADTVPYADVEPYPGDDAYGAAESGVEVEPSGTSEDADSGYSESWDAEVPPGEPPSVVDEVAGLLDRLAERVREEGAAGLKAEMESADRLTSLVAGLLAGYVSGRS